MPGTLVPAAASDRRDAVFQSLLNDPANTSLMLEYARLSVAERDYEAAVGTLERLVRLEPRSQEARLELAQAYYALGQNEAARYHLEIYRDRGDLTAEERDAANAYVEALDKRERRLAFSGYAEAGLFHQTDLDDNGLTFDGAVRAEYDLGRATLARWDTLFRVRGQRYDDLTGLNQTVLQLRTGPVLSLDGTTFGPRVMPYIEMLDVDDDDDASAATSIAFGVGYTTILASGGSLNADLQYGEIDRDGFGVDSSFKTATLGRTWQHSDTLSYGASARYLTEDFDGGGVDRDRWGVRLGARKDLETSLPGLQDLTVDSFVQADFESLSTGRDDDIYEAGVSVRTYFGASSYVNASVTVIDRSSSDSFFDERDTLLSIVAGTEF